MKSIVLLLAAFSLLIPFQVRQTPSTKKETPATKSPPPSVKVENNTYESKASPDKSDAKPLHWYTTVKWSEWLLVVASFLTLLAIAYQAREMSRATNEMRESTKAVQTQVEITRSQTRATEELVKMQRVAMDQWIETDDWTARGFVQPGATEGDLTISFKVVNSTKLLLTLVSVELWFDRQFSKIIMYRNLLLAPDEYMTVDEGTYHLQGMKLDMYRARTLIFEIGVRICYVNAFKESREQVVGYHCDAARGEFSPISFDIPSEEEVRNQKKRTQNPS